MRWPKGALWRRWDLHVHTPESHLNNGFGEDFEQYFKVLMTEAVKREIAVIGVTDYFTIEGYKKIRAYIEDPGKLAAVFDENSELIEKVKEILIVPNIEFRLNFLVEESRVNFHVVFSDQVDVRNIEENFLHELDFVFEGNPQARDEVRKLRLLNIEALGEELKREHSVFRESGKSDIEIGMMTAVVDAHQISEVLQRHPSLFEGMYLLGVEANEDLSKVAWNGQWHNSRKTLIQKSDFLFASNPNTVMWGLGRKDASEEAFMEEFKGLKPCLHGSDAHDFDSLYEPDLKRYCWIKADPTFEGLKQVKYEPEGRVKIQEEKPEAKLDYLVIDRVRFNDLSSCNFADGWIELNPNLNSIIGGKSAGKSLLLYHIAKTIGPENTEKRIRGGDKSIRYEYSFMPEIDFEVQWRDGVIYKLSDGEQGKDRAVTFIPQLYLNALAEDKGEGSDFRSVIENILVGYERYAVFLGETKSSIDENRVKLHGAVSKYLNQRKSIIEERENLKGLGDKKAINQAVLSYRESLKQLREESKFTETEEAQYKALQVQGVEYQTQLRLLMKEKDLLGKIKAAVTNMGKNVVQAVIEPQFSEIRSEYVLDEKSLATIDEYVRKLQKQLAGPLKVFGDEEFGRLEVIDGQIRACLEGAAEITTKIKPFQDKLTNKTKFERLTEELGKELRKLAEIKKKEFEIAKMESVWNSDEIFGVYGQLYSCYINIVAELEQYSKIDAENGIDLIAEVRFNQVRFDENFCEKLSKRTTLRNQFGNMFGEDGNKFVFTRERHITDVREIFDRLVRTGETVRLNRGFNLDDVVHALMDDNFYVEYDLKQGDDRLLQMSPGKRGIILFQLFLQLSNATTPILIDQPEDNLDNRTVYQELNNFIKRKKLDRQIIIVSHNANLVVSTDSEEIIVANQRGENRGAENAEYRFEYVTGALEDKFKDMTQQGVLYQEGIRNHVCEILEGGEEAFKKREEKYALS